MVFMPRLDKLSGPRAGVVVTAALELFHSVGSLPGLPRCVCDAAGRAPVVHMHVHPVCKARYDFKQATSVGLRRQRGGSCAVSCRFRVAVVAAWVAAVANVMGEQVCGNPATGVWVP